MIIMSSASKLKTKYWSLRDADTLAYPPVKAPCCKASEVET